MAWKSGPIKITWSGPNPEPAHEKLKRAIPHVNSILTAIRWKDQAAALEAGSCLWLDCEQAAEVLSLWPSPDDQVDWQ